jgi:hypothetical protein
VWYPDTGGELTQIVLALTPLHEPVEQPTKQPFVNSFSTLGASLESSLRLATLVQRFDLPGLPTYAIPRFIHFYRHSGRALSVGIVEGQYVYLYKHAVTRPISARGIQDVPVAHRQNRECVAGDDGHVLLDFVYQSGERPECKG